MDAIKRFEPFFGEWYVESYIGSGSFGRVYKIFRDELNNRFYSALKYISIPAEQGEVKQLRADGMDEASISTYYGSLAQNISSEITLMNRLKGNTNIVSFEDSRVMPKPDGVGYDIFIRMELLDSLTNRMVDNPLTDKQVVKLGLNICSALSLCAKNDIIHRDIKPDNIFISPNGDYKLGDFGIARQLENTATFMSKKGTYNYMAPEVYKGEKYGASCDIYSLGLVMYRLLNNGRLPFLPPAPSQINPEDRENAIIKRMKGEKLPAPCGADALLSKIVLKACAFDPASRYSSADEMYKELFLYSIGGLAPAVPVQPQTAPKSQPKPAPQVQRQQQPAPQVQRQQQPAPQVQRQRQPSPQVQRQQPAQQIQRQPQPQKSQPAAGGVKDIDELRRMIGYFSQKTAKYREYDALLEKIKNKPKTNPLLLILGAAAIIVGIVIAVEVDPVVGALIIDLVGIPLIPLFFLTNRFKKRGYQKSVDSLDAAADELYRHYVSYGPCRLAPELTNPANLRAILSVITSGTAENITAAINILNIQSAQMNPAVVSDYKKAAAENSARKARVPVVFCPEKMFLFK